LPTQVSANVSQEAALAALKAITPAAKATAWHQQAWRLFLIIIDGCGPMFSEHGRQRKETSIVGAGEM